MLTVLRGGVVFIKDTDAATVYGCCRKGMKVKTKKEEKCEQGNYPPYFPSRVQTTILLKDKSFFICIPAFTGIEIRVLRDKYREFRNKKQAFFGKIPDDRI